LRRRPLPRPHRQRSNATAPHESGQLNQHEQKRREHREKRKSLYDAVVAAHRRGLSRRAIANQLGLNRTTVRRYLRAAEFPERAPRHARPDLNSTPTETIWKSVGQKAATMPHSFVVSCDATVIKPETGGVLVN